MFSVARAAFPSERKPPAGWRNMAHRTAAAARRILPTPSRKEEDSFRPATAEDLDHRRFERNLAAFANYLPAIHRDLVAVKHPRSRLLISRGGDFDIEFGGVRLYGRGARRDAKLRVAEFFNQDFTRTRFTTSPPDSSNLDKYANLAIYRILRRAAGKTGMNFAANRTRDCFHLIVLGVGLAAQLPLLVKETNCRHLVFIEPNIEFLRHSLFTFDWHKFLPDFLTAGKYISVEQHTTAKDIAVGLRNQARYINPAFMDGTYIFKSYRNSLFDTAAQEIAADTNLFMTGLGFLEDECDMVRNTYRNLKDYTGHIFNQSKMASPLPAFVVASGPSLDRDLAFLRANSDRAIVVSCGTSLRILLRNGIVPDFHMEMENVPAVAELMAKLSASFSLKDITLVASSTVDPGVKTYFDRVVFYFRAGLASYPMFATGPEAFIPQGLPTVANLGVSFSQQIGCRTIYLFGVDLGARDPARHHAKDAPYNAGELEFNTVIDQPVAGNLGGMVYSEMIYLWSRDTMQDVILYGGPRFTYYNCSDGVRIYGATPKLSQTITLPAAADKKKTVAEILYRFTKYTPELFDKSWTSRKRVLDVRRFQRTLHECCRPRPRAGRTEPPQGSKYALDYLQRVVRTIIPDTDPPPEMLICRGTIFQTMIGIYYYLNRVTDPRKRRAMERIAREEFVVLIDGVADRIVEFFHELDPEKIAREEKEAVKILAAEAEPKRAAGARGRRPNAKTPAKANRKSRGRTQRAKKRKSPAHRPCEKAARGHSRSRLSH